MEGGLNKKTKPDLKIIKLESNSPEKDIDAPKPGFFGNFKSKNKKEECDEDFGDFNNCYSQDTKKIKIGLMKK